MTTPAEQRERELHRRHADRMPPKFSAKVVGVSFVPGYPQNLHELDAMWGKHMDEPLSVVLIRNPKNEYDGNAIEVHIPALGDGGFIGHLTRPIAARMAPEMDAGVLWSAEMESVLIDPDHLDRPGISITCKKES